jgi:DNA-binding transcriptional ArsR family regulator
MLELLREGPSTATRLGRALGESSGATSYHLRVLEKAGLVEDETERGNGRERWWRRSTPVLYIPTGSVDPDVRAAEAKLWHVFIERDEEAMSRFLNSQERLDEAWRRSSFVGGWHAWATADEVDELGRRVMALVDELRRGEDERPEGAEPVYITFRAVPRPDADA